MTTTTDDRLDARRRARDRRATVPPTAWRRVGPRGHGERHHDGQPARRARGDPADAARPRRARDVGRCRPAVDVVLTEIDGRRSRSPASTHGPGRCRRVRPVGHVLPDVRGRGSGGRCCGRTCDVPTERATDETDGQAVEIRSHAQEHGRLIGRCWMPTASSRSAGSSSCAARRWTMFPTLPSPTASSSAR